MRYIWPINRLRNFIDNLKVLIGSGTINASRALYPNMNYLWDAEVRVFSQWGEDGILDYLFSQLNIVKPRILEIGVGSFRECNSRFAAEFRNASVYGVDQNRKLLRETSALPVLWKTNSYFEIIDVNPSNVRSIQEKCSQKIGLPNLLSLDIDGNDYWILDAMNLSNFEIVVCEYNAIFGAHLNCTIPYSSNWNRIVGRDSYLVYGMSLKAAIELMREKGFTFVGTNRVGNNAFFVRSKLSESLSIELPNSDELEMFTDWRVDELRGAKANGEPTKTDEIWNLVKDTIIWKVDSSEEAPLSRFQNLLSKNLIGSSDCNL